MPEEINKEVEEQEIEIIDEVQDDAVEVFDTDGLSTEEIDLAVIDWKGIKGSEIRKQITDILDKSYIRYQRTSQVRK